MDTKAADDEGSVVVISVLENMKAEPLTRPHHPSAAVAVIIPTYGRGVSVLSTLEKVYACVPSPSEVWVHVDQGDDALETVLRTKYPSVRILASQSRIGPGGGRHRCLLACSTPYAVSFDDDSFPIDRGFFADAVELFQRYPRAAIFAAHIRHRNESETPRSDTMFYYPGFVGCGYAVRLEAYRQVRGYLQRPVAYGLEETDVSLQLFAAGWEIHTSHRLRVFHDTDLKHHQSPEITSASITNVAVYAFLHYPLSGMWLGVIQVANKIAFSIRVGRLRGIASGILRIPRELYRYRRFRRPLSWGTVRKFLDLCKNYPA